ncbi:MAG: hypothetical protein Rubg2KO_13610 [Rubricoccaceae bacterium]
MSRSFFAFALLAFLIGLAAPEPAIAQQTVDYPALGLSFEVPDGWQGQEGDGLYIVSHPSGGMLVMMPHEASTLQELRAGAEAGVDLGDGTNLQANSAIEPFGSEGIRVDMVGLVEWSPTEAHAIGLLSPNGGGVVIYALAPVRQLTDTHRSDAEALAWSVVFSEPVEPPVVQQWRDGLLYRQLAKYNTDTASDGSSSDEVILTLCDGGFSRYTAYQYYRTGAGAHSDAGSNTEYGTWEVVSDGGGGALLSLTYDTGEEAVYELAFEDSKIYLDDARYLQSEGSCE